MLVVYLIDARLRPAGYGAAAFARFAIKRKAGLPSRSSQSERRLEDRVGLEPTVALRHRIKSPGSSPLE